MWKKDCDRFEYLQTLVTEFQDTDSDGELHGVFYICFYDFKLMTRVK